MAEYLAPARVFVRDVLEAGLQAADPAAAVRTSLRSTENALVVAEERIPLEPEGRVFIIAFGKAAPAMAEAAEAVLGDWLAGGVVVAPPGLALSSRRLQLVVGGHPVPDEGSVAGAEAALKVAASAGEDDVVVVLVSGGGSALLCAPAEGVSLAQKQALTKELLASGVAIGEVNTVRKHLSRVKGGRLAAACAPARVAALLVSDVVGDDPSTIASGPTVDDPSTSEDALAVVDRAGIVIPSAVRTALEGNESPALDDPRLARATTRVVLGNAGALEACCKVARVRGVHPLLLSGDLEGESREVGRAHAALARSVIEAGAPLVRPALLVSGGETTVTVRRKGRGGPNQEFALACVRPLAGLPVVVLAVDSDGHDGPTDAAGAIVDGATLGRARALGLDPAANLEGNDAYPFFDELGDLVRMGRTGTNVNDIRLVYIA